MKVFISADIEGCCGVTHWNEATIDHAQYGAHREQMTREVVAACEGALAAGAREILVRDAHGSGRNLIGSDLPREAGLLSAWSGDPLCMVEGLDNSFDAVLFVGYHARAGSGRNPLAHTMSSSTLKEVRLNGEPISEYVLHTWAAETLGVPVVFLAGDRGICEEVSAFNPRCHTFAVKEGQGSATINLHPDAAVQGIREASERALGDDLQAMRVSLPERFALEMHYKEQTRAFGRSFYPGASLLSPTAVGFETEEYYEVLRAVQFLI